MITGQTDASRNASRKSVIIALLATLILATASEAAFAYAEITILLPHRKGASTHTAYQSLTLKNAAAYTVDYVTVTTSCTHTITQQVVEASTTDNTDLMWSNTETIRVPLKVGEWQCQSHAKVKALYGKSKSFDFDRCRDTDYKVWGTVQVVKGGLTSQSDCVGGTGTITLFSAHGKYVAAENTGDLAANRSEAKNWEHFTLIPHADDTVSFGTYHDTYVIALENGDVEATATTIGPWEKFTRVDNADGTVSFISDHGKYVIALENGGVEATATAIGPWEKFQLGGVVTGPANYGSTSPIRSVGNDSKCLHKKDGNWNNGNIIHLWDCGAGEIGNKTWIYEESTGYIRAAYHPGKCLLRKDSNWNNGNVIHLWDCDAGSTSAKTWNYQASTGYIMAKENTAKCLQKKDANWNDGNIIHLWDCDAGSADL